jgi:uncharacterized protein (DUF885 family)
MSKTRTQIVDESVLVELCRMWSNAMRMSKDLDLDLDEMKIIGDRLLNAEAKSIETILLKLRAAHATALRSLPEGDAVRNLLASTINDMDQLEL